MPDPRGEITALRDRIADGDRGGSDRDRDALLELSDNLDLIPSSIGDYRHRDVLRQSVVMSEALGDRDWDLVDVVEERDAAEAVVRWINRTHDNEHTHRTYRKNLRAFARHYLQTDDVPESVAWVPTSTSNDFDPVPSERDLLAYEADIQPMVEAAQNPRDEALLIVQFEAGLRGGELYDLAIGDVFDADHSMGLHVDGKQGERAVHLIVATPYLQQWLGDHPARDDPEAPLWSKLSSAERASYPTFLNYFKQAAERASVSKTVTPTNFRKSNTRWLVRLGFAQPEIEDRQGRARGSDHTARYMARFGEESLEASYAAAHGKDVDIGENAEFAPVTCPRCDKETPRDREFCVWCDFALSHDAAEEAAAVDERHVESAAKASGQTAADVVAVNAARGPAVTRVLAERDRTDGAE